MPVEPDIGYWTLPLCREVSKSAKEAWEGLRQGQCSPKSK